MDARRLLVLACAVMLFALTPARSESADNIQPRVTMSLSGEWEFLPEHENEPIQDGDSYTWGSIIVPALWGNAKNIDPAFAKGEKEVEGKKKLNDVKYCWYRKRFKVDNNLEGLNCLLRIVDVRWSAEVWLNGVRLGQETAGYRPQIYDATAAIRPGQDNVLVIKNGGGRMIPRYDDNVPKIPFGHKGWARGASGIMGDVELHFFRDVTISQTKIDTNIHDDSCRVTIWLTNYGKASQSVDLEIQAREKKSKRAASEVYKASATVNPGETKSLVVEGIKIGNPKLWSPDSPFLYCLDITAKSEGKTCEHIAETFGMREFATKDGNFYLNGKQIFLRGATDLAITGFPSWGASASVLTDRKWIKKFLIDDAKEMNMNIFRTHMGPWYKPYYEIADEGGMMIVGEFPNWPPEGGKEYYHRPGFVEKLFSEFDQLAPTLWNHPSIVIWAACNEPYIWDYTEDENKLLIPYFRKLDPTRPIMRAGAVSEDIADQHNYEGFWTGTIGNFTHSANWLKEHFPDKPLCDTEYLESAVKQFAKPDWGRAQKWMGYNVTLERAEKTHALFAMEQTEVHRRLQFDGILPFWYSMFVSKGEVLGEDKWMTYYALKNAFAPVAVSLGIFDRHFVTGSDLKLEVWAMNDLETAEKGKINVYVVKEDPPYIYAGEPESPLAKQKLEVDIPPYSANPHDVVLPLPKEEGSYWLYATLQVKDQETVISKRPIHVLDRTLAHVKGVRIAVIEQKTIIQDWAKSVGIEVCPADSSNYQVLVIGRNALGSEEVSTQIEKIKEWVNSGGRLIILDQNAWPEGLFGLSVKRAKSHVSYLFKAKGHEADPIFEGIADAYMENWNGFSAEGLTDCFDKSGDGTNLIIGSGGQEGLNSKGLLRLKVGSGEVLACQTIIEERLTHGTREFDPVSERLMVNLITK